MNSNRNRLSGLLEAFQDAFSGMRIIIMERNFRIHLIAGVLVILLGYILDVSMVEWMILLLCMAMVMSLEAMNTAIERVGDKLNPNYDIDVGFIKDVAAAAVLIASLFALTIGGLIFVPKLLVLWTLN